MKTSDYVILEVATECSPHEANTGNSGCLAMDLILPEHFPRKHPNTFPTTPRKRELGCQHLHSVIAKS